MTVLLLIDRHKDILGAINCSITIISYCAHEKVLRILKPSKETGGSGEVLKTNNRSKISEI